MSCRIKLYETTRTAPHSYVSLRATSVQLVAVEQANLTNCSTVQPNKRLIGGGYGVDLPFIPGSFAYQVAIVDIAQVYAGATVSNLNGAMPGDVEVVVFKMPMSAIGNLAGGASAAQVRTATLTYSSWSPEEKQAILSVMNALGSLRGSTASTVVDFLGQYERALVDRGIDPGLF